MSNSGELSYGGKGDALAIMNKLFDKLQNVITPALSRNDKFFKNGIELILFKVGVGEVEVHFEIAGPNAPRQMADGALLLGTQEADEDDEDN